MVRSTAPRSRPGTSLQYRMGSRPRALIKEIEKGRDGSKQGCIELQDFRLCTEILVAAVCVSCSSLARHDVPEGQGDGVPQPQRGRRRKSQRHGGEAGAALQHPGAALGAQPEAGAVPKVKAAKRDGASQPQAAAGCGEGRNGDPRPCRYQQRARAVASRAQRKAGKALGASRAAGTHQVPPGRRAWPESSGWAGRQAGARLAAPPRQSGSRRARRGGWRSRRGAPPAGRAAECPASPGRLQGQQEEREDHGSDCWQPA